MSALDLAFAALSDPTRRRIVARLTRGEIRVTDLAQPFAMSLNAVSKHVKALERAGLVRRTRIGREHWLRLRAQPLRQVQDWVSRYERFWNQRLDALGEFLDQQKAQTMKGRNQNAMGPFGIDGRFRLRRRTGCIGGGEAAHEAAQG